ncbi:MAG: MlaD family protein [Pseudomonadota bacterium]
METRASHILVGCFVLIAILAGALSIAWLAGFDPEDDGVEYDIFFTGSVSGLSVGNPVRYRGIPVGAVTNMRINPANVEQVHVVIEIPRTTPVKEDATASLEFQGITGIAYVQINGGTVDAPLLVADGGERAQIQATQSALQAVLEKAPELIANIVNLTDQAGQFLSEDNARSITQILDNINQFSGQLNDHVLFDEAVGQQLRGTIARLEQIAIKLDEAASQTTGLLGEGRALVGRVDLLVGRVDLTVADIQHFVHAFAQRSESLAAKSDSILGHADTALGELTPAIQKAYQTLDQIEQMIAELRPHTLTIGQQGSQAARDAAELIAIFNQLVLDHREQFDDFASHGLSGFTLLANETRELVSSLLHITRRLEQDAAGFLFGDQLQGVSFDE